MKAMILAAGLGTRLRPLTDTRPKALVEVCGRTLLEITLARLRDVGVADVIVNVHHFADQVVAYLHKSKNFGMRVQLSREDDLLLDTGGGLKQASWFFEKDPAPFLVHNVDVLSDIDLRRLLSDHNEAGALATVAVQKRHGARQLLFGQDLQLCGRQKVHGEKPEIVRDCALPEPLAFCGIHVISPRLLQLWKEDGAFSIVDTYLRLAGAGEKVLGFRADQYYWRDLGKPDSLKQAAQDVQQGRLTLGTA
jgi:NDP-sugar pyrophosphorylase family protein